MKTHSTLAIIFLLSKALCQAQQATTAPSPTPYTIVSNSRTSNSRCYERTVYELSPSGQVIPHLQRYTELATGLCYQRNGQWLDSQEQINILPDGTACSTNGPHQAYWPPDIYNGIITLITPDGLRLQSRPVCLSYDNGTNIVLLAEITNSIGQLISSNQVIYPNAFVGISADLLYTYRKSGFEQDVIFRAQPPTPEQCGLSGNCRLQLLTEFFNSPTPVESVSPVNRQDDLQDTTLTFGRMKMIEGKAFLMNTNNSQGNPNQAFVYKSWEVVDGRTLLIEQTPYQQISSQLEMLPLPSAGTVSSSNFRLHKVSTKRILPPARMAVETTNSVQMARDETTPGPGMVFDYVTMDASETNAVFQGDTTYFVSGDYELSGTTVLEGGTVIKMNSSGELDVDDSDGDGNATIDCETSEYRPAIFTSLNDNTVGDTINGSSGTPSYSDVVNFITANNSTNIAFSNVRFNYCSYPIEQNASPSSLEVQDCQFNQVRYAMEAYNIALYNVLIANNTFLRGGVVVLYGPNFVGEQVTASGDNTAFISAINPDNTIAMTNCIITSTNSSFNLAPNGGTFATNDVVIQPSAPVFQTVGGGNYYLTNGSPYRGAGTANIDPGLLADIQTKTTWPPIVYSDTNISSLTTLSPAVPRDTNSSPDLGYLYDPLDYVFGGCDLHSNLTITTGTAIGWFQENGSYSGEPYAISLENGANLSFNGNATQPCYFANYVMVQEGGNGNWTDSGYVGGIMFNGSSTTQEPLLSGDFTKWTLDSDVNNIFRDTPAYGAGDFKNCEFYNASLGTYKMQYLNFTNCLFFRDCSIFWDQDYALSFNYENCTFYNGALAMVRQSGQSPSFWLVENTSFDGTAFSTNDNYDGNTNYTLFNYNTYNTNNLSWQNYSIPYMTSCGTLETAGFNDVKLTNYNWESSWFGNFYLPPDSPLIEAGSTNANLLSLYHFTTQTNQMPENTNVVDIGYHYVATDQNGNPLDNNGDGIPDYLEDPLGNGLPYDGTNWALAINIQPTNQTVLQGTSVTLSVTAGGVSPLAYQWYFNSIAVANATNASLPFDSVQTNSAGSYYVIVTNNFGAVTSSVVTLTVLVPPTVSITNPVNNQIIIASNTNITLMAIASDFAGTVTQVQFFAETTSLGSATNAPYTLVWSNAPAGNYGLTAVATDNYGLVSTSSVVNVLITPLFATNTMLLWLNANAIAGLTNDASISNWPDSSGWEHNATQSTLNSRPLYVTNILNDLPVVQFNGTNSYFNLAASLFNDAPTGAEIFAVVQVTTNTIGSSHSLWYLGQWNQTSEYFPYSDGSIRESFGCANSTYNLEVPLQPLTQYNVYEVTAQNGNWEAWLNGLLQYQAINNTYGYNSSSPFLGCGESSPYFAGNIAEVLVFNRPLTSSERTIVNAYLNGKYGLVPAIPAAPTNLVATAISPTQIGLTWSEALTNGGATQIAIERSTSSSGPFTRVAQVLDALSYVDTNLMPGTTFYYEVQAINVTQWSPVSNEALATTPTTGTNMPLSSLILWLKADSGLPQGSTNTPVNLWADQSGNGNDASQVTNANQPLWVPDGIGSLPVVQFNGTNSYFNLPSFLSAVTRAEAFVVLKTTTPYGSKGALWSWGSYQIHGNDTQPGYPSTNGSIFEDFGSSTIYNMGVSSQSLTNYNVYEVMSQANNWESWINGILQYQTNVNEVGFSSSLYLGVAFGYPQTLYFDGGVAEVLVFNRALTSSERTTVNAY